MKEVSLFSIRSTGLFICFSLLTLLITGCQDQTPPDDSGNAKTNRPTTEPLPATNGVPSTTINGLAYTFTNRLGYTYTVTNTGIVMTNMTFTNGVLIVSTNATYTSSKTHTTNSDSISIQWASAGCPNVNWLQFVMYEVVPTNGASSPIPGTEGPRLEGKWYVDAPTPPGNPTPYYPVDDPNNHSIFDRPTATYVLSKPRVTAMIKHFYVYGLCDSNIVFSFQWKVTFTKSPAARVYEIERLPQPCNTLMVPGQNTLPACEPVPGTNAFPWTPPFPLAGW